MASSRNRPSTDPLSLLVREHLRKMLAPGRRVAVAFSGGLDSSVLLHMAAHADAGCVLSAVHVHHGLSAHADEWAEFCRARCDALDVPLHVIRIDVPHNAPEGLEAAARRLRYQVFDRIEADHVLLAHHANDQAETLLFNLMRGAGVLGAAGIPAVSGDRRYVRPLLAHTRNDLEAYANEHRLRWVEDDSNSDTAFSRNFIRREVLPVLASRFPAAAANLARATEHFAEAQEMLDEMARFDLAGVTGFPVPVAQLKALSEARARNVLRYLLCMRGLQAPSGKRLTEILRQFVEAGPDKHPSLALSAYRLYRSKGMVMLDIADS